MSEEMNKFINKLIKYELIRGIIFSLILSVGINSKFAIIYLFGFIISMINFVVHARITEMIMLSMKNKFVMPMSYLIRIIIVVLLAVPFITSFINLIAYLIGYISWYAILVSYVIRNQERM